MSDAEGPYFVTKQVDDEMGSRWFHVNGPGISDPRMTATSDFDEAMLARDFMNRGWKAGRASREGLRKALADIARWEHRKDVVNPYRCSEFCNACAALKALADDKVEK